MTPCVEQPCSATKAILAIEREAVKADRAEVVALIEEERGLYAAVPNPDPFVSGCLAAYAYALSLLDPLALLSEEEPA